RRRRGRWASGGRAARVPAAWSSDRLPSLVRPAHHGLCELVLLGRVGQRACKHRTHLDRYAALDEAALTVDADEHVVLIAVAVGKQGDLNELFVFLVGFVHGSVPPFRVSLL